MSPVLVGRFFTTSTTWEAYSKQYKDLIQSLSKSLRCWRKLKSPLDCKEIKPINPKGNQSWIFIGKTEAEAPVLWPPDAKSWLIGIALHAGKDLRQKWAADDEMVRWYHQLNGHEFEQTLGDSGGQRILECDSLWNHKESDQTRLSDWTTSPPSDYELL